VFVVYVILFLVGSVDGFNFCVFRVVVGFSFINILNYNSLMIFECVHEN